MTYFKPTNRAVAASAAVVAAGLAFSAPAHADAQYKADRAYCMSGQAAEPRDLCLKEAAAAQADRHRSSHRSAAHHKPHKAKKGATAAPDRSASAP